MQDAEETHSGQQRPRKRRRLTWRSDVLSTIRALAGVNWRPAEIRAALDESQRWTPAEIPSEKTISRLVAEVAPPDPDSPWRVEDAEADELAFVPSVLRAAWRNSNGRTTTVSRKLAVWIVRVRIARPDLDAWTVYRIAHRYRANEILGEPTETLDLHLATYEPDARIPPDAVIIDEVRDPDLERKLMQAMERADAALQETKEGDGGTER